MIINDQLFNDKCLIIMVSQVWLLAKNACVCGMWGGACHVGWRMCVGMSCWVEHVMWDRECVWACHVGWTMCMCVNMSCGVEHVHVCGYVMWGGPCACV